MTDVNLQQTPESSRGGGMRWALALVAIVLVLVVAWFVFGDGLRRTSTTNVEISTPDAAAPSGGVGGGAPSAAPSGGAPKTPYP